MANKKVKRVIPEEMNEIKTKALLESLTMKLRHACETSELNGVQQLVALGKVTRDVQDNLFKFDLSFDLSEYDEKEPLIDMNIDGQKEPI